MIAVIDVPHEHTNRYGILSPGAEIGALVEVRGLFEKLALEYAPSNKAIVSGYLLQPEIFGLPECQELGTGDEIQPTDSLAVMIGDKPFGGHAFEAKCFDCGNKLGFLEVTLGLSMAREDLGAGLHGYLRDLAPTL